MHHPTRIVRTLCAAFGGWALLATPGAFAQTADAPEAQRIEITGSAVRRIQAEGSLPVQVINRDQIERSGATSVADLIQSLPALQGFTNEGASVGGGGTGFSGASVHNLGETRTLVLLNGRRLATFAGQVLTGALAGIDLNTIPLAAVERIEVLTDGASSLYGADAIGGVVNFITKKNSTEGVAALGYSSPQKGGKERRVSLSKGFGNLDTDGFNVLVGANFEKRSTLASVDREFARTGVINFELNGRNVSFFNGSPRGIPGNVTHTDGYLVSPYFAENGTCPEGHVPLLEGPTTPACYYDYVQQLEILPERERAALMTTASFKLGRDHTAFAEVLLSTTKNVNRIAPPPGELLVGPDSPFWSSVLLVDPGATDPAVVPYRAADAGKRTQEDKTEARHLVLGLEGALAGWDYNTSITHSVNDQASSLLGGYVKLNAFFAALDSGLVNPFVLPGNQSPEAQAAIDNAKILGFWEGGKSTLDVIQVRGSRPLMALGGGDLAMATGVSWSREKFQKSASDIARGVGDVRFGDTAAIVPYSADRKNVGVFAELVAPLTKELEVTGSVRYDNYSDFGNANTAKLSARFQPTKTLLLRGSFGTGFKAPTVPQVNATRQEFGVTGGNYTCGADLAAIAASLGAECPVGNVQYNVQAGGNPNLQPEKSRQWTVGVAFEPTPEVSITADLWEVRLKNTIGQIDEGTVFGDPNRWRSQFTTYTDPGTGQTLIALLADNQNLGEARESGIDLSVRGRANLGFARLTSTLAASYWLKSEYQFEPGGEFFTSLGKFGPDGNVVFRWQGSFVNTLEYGNWAHTLTANFKSGYRDQVYSAADFAVFDPVTFEPFAYVGEVNKYFSFDWQSQWKATKDLTLTAGVLNLFDRNPPRSLKSAGGGQQIGYDDRYYDPRGRTWYVNAEMKF